MNRLASCPDVRTFEGLVAGKLAPEQAEPLLQHLEGCDACARTVQTLPAPDTLLCALPWPDTLGSGPEDDRVEAIMDRLSRTPLPIRPGAAACSAAPAARDVAVLLAPAQGPGEIGRLGPYRVLRVLGQGGMGIVFEAEDPQLQRPVALKAMKPDLAADEGARQRFLREAQATAALNHDHIVHIYQVSEDRGWPFFAMQLLEGMTLEALLQKQGKLEPAQVLRIGKQVALALQAAHTRGLIHRDIKPANLWLEKEHGGRVKVLDFGLARPVQVGDGLTSPGTIMGTPGFMAPEQARGLAVDSRADLFSLGCVLYEITTGQKAFHGPDMLAILSSLAVDTPLPPHTVNPEVLRPLSDLIVQLLEKEPGRRPASAQEVVARLAALESLSAPLAIPVRSTDEVQPALSVVPEGPRRRGRRWLAVAAGLLLLLGGGVLLQQVIIRITDKQGNMRDIELKPGETAQMLVKEPPGDFVKKPIPPLPIPHEPPPPFKGGALYPTALVSRPAKLKGVQCWTFETVGHRHPVQVVAYSPDGKWLASMDSECVRIWEADKKYNLVRVFMAAPAGFTCLAWAPDAVHLATGHVGGEVGLWDLRTGRKLRTQKADGDVRSVSWSPDGKRLVAGTDKDQTFVWETASGKLLHQKKLGAVVACSPDDKTLATCNDAGRVQLWRADTLEHVRDCKFEWGTGSTNDLRRALSWSSNSKRLLLDARVDRFASAYRSWILNSETGQLHTQRDSGTYGSPVVLSPDGKFLAENPLGGDRLFFNQLDLDTGKLVRKSEGAPLRQQGAPSAITWSPDGTTIVIGLSTGAVTVWEVEAGQMRRVLEGQPARSLAMLSWSADGKMLHSARSALTRSSVYRIESNPIMGWGLASVFPLYL